MDKIWSLIRAIVFLTILRLLVHSQKTRYPLKEQAAYNTDASSNHS